MAITKRPSSWQDVLTVSKIVRLAVSQPEARVRRLYELFPKANSMTENSSYLNMGYWESPEDTLDEASQKLAEKVADAAGVSEGDRVLDCGFGYGDQDFLWLERHNPAKIVGLNVTPSHVRAAQDKARERGVADRLDFREGSATELDFAPDSFDRVIALESSFHFLTREDFFRQAYRVLRPGGVLVTADMVPLVSGPKGRGVFQDLCHKENWYDGDEYLTHLKAAGFTDVSLTSIRDNVFEPWVAYMERKIQDPGLRQRTSKLYHAFLRRELGDQARMHRQWDGLDYVIVAGHKPE